MNIDKKISELVFQAYKDCFKNDIFSRYRFHPNDPENYIAPFEIYRDDYSQVTELGIGIVNPFELGYLHGRNGHCIMLTLFLLGRNYPLKGFEQEALHILDFPDLSEPEEGCVVLYHSAPLEFPRELIAPDHVGIFRTGKVLSKWGPCPIFEHDVHAMPYAGNFVYEGRKIASRAWATFKHP
ncbi:hypothetical protein HYS31_08315 [Candidatus Woesearchaeota archaeon]|nr:hypothetical protein [Candidatus Woesearchaeota archaeon]